MEKRKDRLLAIAVLKTHVYEATLTSVCPNSSSGKALLYVEAVGLTRAKTEHLVR